MKRFLGLLQKEFFHIFRDVRTMMIIFGMPIAQIMLFGYVITNEIKDVKVAVLDYSGDAVTNELIRKIDASEFFIVDQRIYSENEIEPLFHASKVKEVIVLEKNFARKLTAEGEAAIQLILDATDPNSANLISKYTAGICMDHIRTQQTDTGMTAGVQTETRMWYNEDMKGAFMFVPGTMAFILMLLSALMASISIAREKEFGSMEVLLVSPLKPMQVVVGKVMPYILLAFVNAVSVILVGNIVFGVPLHGSNLLLMLESVLFVITALSLGIMISTFAKTQETAMFIAMFALMLPTLLLSGFIFPIANMPAVLQWLSCIIPARWYLDIIKSIMLKDAGFGFLWQQTLILIGMTVVFIAISVKKYKLRLE